MIQTVLNILNDYKRKGEKETTVFSLIQIGLNAKEIRRLICLVDLDFLWNDRTFFNRRSIVEKTIKGE